MRRFGYCKVASCVPRVVVAECAKNAERIIALMREADSRNIEIAAFPELSITGYTCGDLLLQQSLRQSAERALLQIADATKELNLTAIVGLPVAVDGRLYNCAAVVSGGEVCGLVPKSHIPNDGEFCERRWFASGADVESTMVNIGGYLVDFGTDLLFERDGVRFCVEVGEDLMAPVPPSVYATQSGAHMVFNVAASSEQVTKYGYMADSVRMHSARTMSAYILSSAGFGESSTDLVFAGNAFIAENGEILTRAERFTIEEQLVVADVDISHIESMRLRSSIQSDASLRRDYIICGCNHPRPIGDECDFERYIEPMPFVPSDEAALYERCREVLEIQATGLAQRLSAVGCSKVVIGISGGLDSTLALLAVVRTFDKLSLDRAGIIGVTMPGFGTSGRTYNNATELMRKFGITMREISIKAACIQHFADIGLPEGDRSVSYENAQARERTQILMDVANMCGAMVIGTGDLSELALGWATYNGDQMSMYGVNGSIPKTLVRHLVRWYALNEASAEVGSILLDIVDTPVSPELLPVNDKGEIAQKTEDLVGPYELHDFFLYNFVRRGFEPAKIEFLAQKAFDGQYDKATIRKWLATFLRRFFSQQFKRSAMPDGVKTGSVSLSPRGDWRMPSDASVKEWLADLE